MYRSICSRNTWSDVNGEWRGTDGKVQKLKNKDDVALGVMLSGIPSGI